MKIRDILLSFLSDSDSFVYLTVIQTLVRLVDINRKLILPDLINLFHRNKDSVGEDIVTDTPNETKSNVHLTEIYTKTKIKKEIVAKQSTSNIYINSNEILSNRSRALLGEVLVWSLRRAGDLLPIYVPQVVAVCIRIIRHRPKLNVVEDGGVTIDVLNKMKISIEGNISDTEHETNADNIDAAIMSADSVFLRQSAMSLLAEAMGLAGWSASKHIVDVLDIAINSLRIEIQSTQESISMRR